MAKPTKRRGQVAAPATASPSPKVDQGSQLSAAEAEEIRTEISAAYMSGLEFVSQMQTTLVEMFGALTLVAGTNIPPNGAKLLNQCGFIARDIEGITSAFLRIENEIAALDRFLPKAEVPRG